MISPDLSGELQSWWNGSIVQSAGAQSQRKKSSGQPRLRKKTPESILNLLPGLRRFLRSPWWLIESTMAFALTAAIVVALLFGPQRRAENVAFGHQ